MKDRRQPTRAEWERITTRRPVIRRLSNGQAEGRLRDGGKKQRLFLEKYEALAVEMVRGEGVPS